MQGAWLKTLLWLWSFWDQLFIEQKGGRSADVSPGGQNPGGAAGRAAVARLAAERERLSPLPLSPSQTELKGAAAAAAACSLAPLPLQASSVAAAAADAPLRPRAQEGPGGRRRERHGSPAGQRLLLAAAAAGGRLPAAGRPGEEGTAVPGRMQLHQGVRHLRGFGQRAARRPQRHQLLVSLSPAPLGSAAAPGGGDPPSHPGGGRSKFGGGGSWFLKKNFLPWLLNSRHGAAELWCQGLSWLEQRLVAGLGGGGVDLSQSFLFFFKKPWWGWKRQFSRKERFEEIPPQSV